VSIGLIDEIDAKKIRHRKSFRQTAFSGKLIVHVSCPDVIFRSCASISTLDRAAQRPKGDYSGQEGSN